MSMWQWWPHLVSDRFEGAVVYGRTEWPSFSYRMFLWSPE